MFRIVNTDRDYPDEWFTDDGPFETESAAQLRADELNPVEKESSRYFMVVEMPYKLQPGFEP